MPKPFPSPLARCLLLLALSLAPFFVTPARAEDPLWRTISERSVIGSRQREFTPRAYRTMALNTPAMDAILTRAPMEFSQAARASAIEVQLPKPDGSFERFRVVESPMISAEVAQERPDWKTYAGRGIDDPTAVMRMSWSNEGLSAYVIGKDGSYYVDPYASGNRQNYIVYAKDDAAAAKGEFHCAIDRYISDSGASPQIARRAGSSVGPSPEFTTGANLRTYRLAIATTGEYTIARGGQAAALTSVMNGVNRINTIYRRDLSVALTLVSGTNLIFPDPATDPYNNTDDGQQLTINHNTIANTIGLSNFDLGHLFGTGGGGVASSPSVCNDSAKGEGYSARGTTTGDPFFVDYVAHEMGHQLSAQHTYNTRDAGSGACTTRSNTNAYEVASGSTIMSYVGICDDRNLQQFSDDVFHERSLIQIINYVNGSQGNCGTVTASGNSVPVVTAPAGFTIPKQTPFTLTASATDANSGDSLTYSWEEYDLATAASGPAGNPASTYDVDSDGVLRPLFRAYLPKTSPSRTFPSLPYILNNANVPPLTFTGTSPAGAACENGGTCVTGENLPTVNRTMNFRVIVRDNQTGIADASTSLTVAASAGPFRVTAPNTNVTVAGGSSLTVNWDVSTTDQAPVSAANVNILLSTDGGQTFPTALASNVANNGTQNVTVPNSATTTARIKVEAANNIFFDISDANFTITGGTGPTPTPSPTPVEAANISTRGLVGTGDQILIGGFIVRGSANKSVLVRAIGPSLSSLIANPLPDPTLELRGANGVLIASNNDWQDTQAAAIQATMLAPTNSLESAILYDAAPGAYTALMSGRTGTTATGVGLVEVYDAAPQSGPKLANISTRGFISTGDDVLIGGFILRGVTGGATSTTAVVRAIGPSLTALGVPGALTDPMLELRDSNGAIVLANDNWGDDPTQAARLNTLQLAPTNAAESAIVADLASGAYTAIVRGKNNSTGIGLVEFYNP